MVGESRRTASEEPLSARGGWEGAAVRRRRGFFRRVGAARVRRPARGEFARGDSAEESASHGAFGDGSETAPPLRSAVFVVLGVLDAVEMNRFVTRVFAAAVFAAALVGCADEPARDAPTEGRLRIVSLAPSVTETLFAIGAGDSVVGVSNDCNHPPRVRTLPRVGGYVCPEAERILALSPTLVVGTTLAAHREVMEVLERKGVRTLVIPEKGLKELHEGVLRLGEAVGRRGEAERLWRGMKRALDEIKRRTADAERPRTLVLVGFDPMVAVGRRGFINELLEICGGENALETAAPYPQLDAEAVLVAAPEVIIEVLMGGETTLSSSLLSRLGAAVPAVRDGRVFRVDPDLFCRPGPRVVEAARELERILHGK